MQGITELLVAPNKSEQLTKFFKQNRHGTVKVCYLGWDSFSGKVSLPKKGTCLRDNFKYIYITSLEINRLNAKGTLTEFNGVQLGVAVRANTRIQQLCAIFKEPIEYRDITKEFLEDYKHVGMCAYLDERHIWGDVSPRVRECTNCGKREKKYVRLIKEVYWKAAS